MASSGEEELMGHSCGVGPLLCRESPHPLVGEPLEKPPPHAPHRHSRVGLADFEHIGDPGAVPRRDVVILQQHEDVATGHGPRFVVSVHLVYIVAEEEVYKLAISRIILHLHPCRVLFGVVHVDHHLGCKSRVLLGAPLETVCAVIQPVHDQSYVVRVLEVLEHKSHIWAVWVHVRWERSNPLFHRELRESGGGACVRHPSLHRIQRLEESARLTLGAIPPYSRRREPLDKGLKTIVRSYPRAQPLGLIRCFVGSLRARMGGIKRDAA
mmetsp:Transcript_65034/g.205463  ORF Transcript_65034/g.205463 Transcript_65034/m.205463 type:complete len:268 (-) Transcript_65034:511-1314(-)